MREFELIDRFFFQATQKEKNVVLGIGDDCALMSVPQGYHLAVSTDSMVEGVHFPHGMAADKIASRALCAALSDLAAIGAEPRWITLALTLPEADENWLAAFSNTLHHHLKRFNCALVGGDTTRGSLNVGFQVMGIVPEGSQLTRAGAKIGDAICVTQTLGDGAAALALLEQTEALDESAQDYLERRFYAPEPQLQEGMLLRRYANSAIDISDGLLADLGHICDSSNVGANLNVEKIPISNVWREQVTNDKALQWALLGGDDYQLCFTLSVEKLALLRDKNEIAFTEIGNIRAGSGINLSFEGRPFSLPPNIEEQRRGYQHFD